MQHHDLKIFPKFFEAVIDGTKTFEIRKNDRGFKPGDTVKLREVSDPAGPLDYFTGRTSDHRIGYVTDFSQMPGFVVFSLLPYEWQEGDLNN